jgi:hypothetical protein
MSALGHKRTHALQEAMSALPPIATAKANTPQMVMAALPPKADRRGAKRNVRYGPIADETNMLSQFPVCLKFRMIYDPVFD